MKWCNKCQQWKDESKFHKDKSKKDGLRSGGCKECANQDKREYYSNNRDKKLQYQREYTENHKEEISEKDRKYYTSPLNYNSTNKVRKEVGTYEEIRESSNGNVEVECANCNGWFEPTKRQIRNRLNAINGKGTEGEENRLYCSDNCKKICPIYNQISYPKHQKPETSRIDQPELRQMVLEEHDYTCIQCGKHIDETKLICHHIEPVVCNPVESADTDNCIVLCEDCHDEVHKQSGCRLSDLKKIFIKNTWL